MSRSLGNGWSGLALVMFVAAACHSSGGQRPESPGGTVILALTGSAQGVSYRLRNARFVIAPASGSAPVTLDSESDPAATFLRATLATGSYSVELQPGWALERVDTAQVVDATLTSPNPTTFQIFAGSDTKLTYQFSTSGGVVTIGTGTVTIGIEISVTDGGAPDGGAVAGCTVSPNSCPAGFACQSFAGAVEGTTFTMCVLSCDPVTQRRSDGAPACASSNPAAPQSGCYGINDVYTCAPAGNSSKTHGVPAAAGPSGQVFLNSCAAGYQPRFFASSTDSTIVCSAYCQPAPTYLGNAGSANGVPPYSCADRGAPAGTECRYLSWATDSPTALGNAIGVCFNPGAFTYDADSNPATPNVPFPSCSQVSSNDLDGNGSLDYLEWGCGPLPIP